MGSGEVANMSTSTMVSCEPASSEQRSRFGNVWVSSFAASARTMQEMVSPGLFRVIQIR